MARPRLRPFVRRDFFEKSRQGEKIETFWSHSWHGGYVMKTLTRLGASVVSTASWLIESAK